jgi:neutral ceramidase
VRVPVGGWSTFAAHGTVTKSSFQFYNRDHHASAAHVFEREVRRAGKVPPGQAVVNVFGNSDEGDQSAGLNRHGPAASDYVGREEAAAMLRAWKAAGGALRRELTLDSRWTRVCFCGQETEGGAVAASPMIGFPFLTGSEEERGPLFDVTGQPLEGTRAPVDAGPQGNKSGIQLSTDTVPRAVPLMAVRVGDRMIVSIPGEATAEVGARIRASVLAATRGGGITGVIVSGIANEFIQYFTTPEEYTRQHYEGGSTLYGKYSSNLLKQELAELGRRLVAGEAAQAAFAFDPTNGVVPSGPAYSQGAASGQITDQPASHVRRLRHAQIGWKGGPEGLDRPLDKGFVIVERRVKRRWQEATNDLGLEILWTVNPQGGYSAKWEIPLDAPRGHYRFVIQANRYRLESQRFRVVESNELKLREVGAGPGRVGVMLDYPPAVRDVDLTHRPASADGGAVFFRAGRRGAADYRSQGGVFSMRAAQATVVSARDRFHNVAPGRLRLGG